MTQTERRATHHSEAILGASLSSRSAIAGLATLAFWIGLLSLVPVAALAGGMASLMMVLAVALAVRVWLRPEEATPAGALFLIACNVLLPTSARYDWSWRDYKPWEMYYWAAGLLVITLAAVARIGIRVLLRVPASVKAFVLVAIADGCRFCEGQ